MFLVRINGGEPVLDDEASNHEDAANRNLTSPGDIAEVWRIGNFPSRFIMSSVDSLKVVGLDRERPEVQARG